MDYVKLEDCNSYKKLLGLKPYLKMLNLASLLSDHARCERLIKTANGVTLDLSRELLTGDALDLLLALSRELRVKERSLGLFSGAVMNPTEKQAALHTALRMPREANLVVSGQNVSKDVHDVLDRVKEFAVQVRSGKVAASDGKPFDSVLSIGIGGSYLGTLFTSEAFMCHKPAREAAKNFKIRFLSNVDPASLRAVTSKLDPNRTLVSAR